MNSRKRNKLKAKRTPWIKSRYSKWARFLRQAQCSAICAQGMQMAKVIAKSNAGTKEERLQAIAECRSKTLLAIDRVPLYGSKTV